MTMKEGRRGREGAKRDGRMHQCRAIDSNCVHMVVEMQSIPLGAMGPDPAGPSGGYDERWVGLFRAVVRAMSLRACSGDVGPRLTFDHCSDNSTFIHSCTST